MTHDITQVQLHHLDKKLDLLLILGEQIMTAIAEFAAAQQAFNDRQDVAIADIQGDIKSLNDQIAALQASSGAISAEDQASLDAISAHASSVADKLDALDALTPPVVSVP